MQDGSECFVMMIHIVSEGFRRLLRRLRHFVLPQTSRCRLAAAGERPTTQQKLWTSGIRDSRHGGLGATGGAREAAAAAQGGSELR